MTASDVARRYIDTVGQRDLTPLETLFHADLVAKVGDDTFDKAGWLQGLRRLLPALVRNDIRHVSSDGEQAVVVYDFVTDTTAGSVPCAELVTVRDAAIEGIELIFERLHWPEVLAALQQRAADASLTARHPRAVWLGRPGAGPDYRACVRRSRSS